MDIKGGINKPLDEFLRDKNKLCYMIWHDRPFYKSSKHAVTAFLIWPKGHPLLSYIVREMSRRIHQDFLNILPLLWKTGHQILESENYFDDTFSVDATGGAYYDYVKSRGLHWSQKSL